MKISLDTNIWIFGILGQDSYCERLIKSLSNFEVLIPDQVRVELERNLTASDMKMFYYFIAAFSVAIDFEPVPKRLITKFKGLGLKKGDAEIGAFCEWRGIEMIVSDNRDFLRGLTPDHSFSVISPKEFCDQFLP